MEMRIDPDSTVPIYLQIIYAIKLQVATGQLKPGEQLPTVRGLATDLRVNPNTVARAYDLLDTEGVIITQRGQGTYVREHPDDAHLARIRQEQLRAMMDGVVHKALSLGYTTEEIQAAFEGERARWASRQQAAASTRPAPSAGNEANFDPQEG